MARSYWLMKTEPDTFSIDDLARVEIEPWTGVRNFQARNLMRDRMRVGDDVLFYHSSADPSGVAGLARVHRTGVVDDTQFDPASEYHDPRSDRADPRWICVDVRFVEKFPNLVPLADLRRQAGLEQMALLRKGTRLSVQPVTAAEYRIVVKMARRPPRVSATGASRTTPRR
jgi:predicted RNA-binding protein with PUA-like domain